MNNRWLIYAPPTLIAAAVVALSSILFMAAAASSSSAVAAGLAVLAACLVGFAVEVIRNAVLHARRGAK